MILTQPRNSKMRARFLVHVCSVMMVGAYTNEWANVRGVNYGKNIFYSNKNP